MLVIENSIDRKNIEVSMLKHSFGNEKEAAVSAAPVGDYYEIRIEGELSLTWADWFGGLALANLENGQSVLSGPVRDQAELHGVLARIRDLNLKLVLVRKM